MNAREAWMICEDMEKMIGSKLSSEQRKKIMRTALKVKLNMLPDNGVRTVETCAGEIDRSKFYRFHAYSKACRILDALAI